jgi:hypothetical protein
MKLSLKCCEVVVVVCMCRMFMRSELMISTIEGVVSHLYI